MNKLHRQGMEDSYRAVKSTIDYVCNWFARTHGGDPEELHSEALQHFVTAYQTYNPATAAWSTYVRDMVFRGLQTTARQIAVRNKALARQDVDFERLARPDRFDVEQFTLDLSPHAAELVRLVCDPPAALRHEAKKLRYQNDPHSIARVVFQFCKTIGWSVTQVAAAAKEIGEALRG